MRKIIVLITLVFVFCGLKSMPVLADTATANNMLPVLRAMYHVDEAEAILRDNKNILNECRKNKASAYDTALAQAAVTDASNLLNTLNALIARDTLIISAAPAGVVNPPSFATNSLAAQGAWSDYFTKARAGHALIWPAGQIPGSYATAIAIRPFSMY